MIVALNKPLRQIEILSTMFRDLPLLAIVEPRGTGVGVAGGQE